MKSPLSPPRLTEKQGPERKRIKKEPVTRKAGLLFGMGLSGIRAGYPLSERQQVALLMQMTAEESANSPGEPWGRVVLGPRRPSSGTVAQPRRPLPVTSAHPLLGLQWTRHQSTPPSRQCVRRGRPILPQKPKIK